MFTGLIRELGSIKEIKRPKETKSLSIQVGCQTSMFEGLTLGASIACNGICLSVTQLDKQNQCFWADISEETLQRSTINQWVVKQTINLETSLKLGDTMDGHFVSGHIDTVGEIKAITQLDNEHRELVIALPQRLSAMVAPKGSICIDGISLTLNNVLQDKNDVLKDMGLLITMNIIPITWRHTCLQHQKIGGGVNVEVDMVARYSYQASEHFVKAFMKPIN